MRPVKIITDSCSDLTLDLLEKYNIDYVKMNVSYKGQTKAADLDWDLNQIKEYYKLLRKGERIYTTQVPVDRFNAAFTRYLDMNFDVVYIGCSSQQSGSVNTAKVIARQLSKKYPEAQILIIDSYNSSAGEGMLAIEAAKLASEGLSAEDIEEHIISIRKRVNQFVTVDSLEHLKRTGKIKASAAFLGNIMNTKPVIISDANGVQTTVKKAKGRDGSLVEIVQLLKEAILDGQNQTVYLVHSDCSENDVNKVEELIKASVSCKEIVTLSIGPVTGAAIGPDAIGVFAFGKEVRYSAAE